MELQSEQSGEVSIVAVRGEYLDASVVDEFKRDIGPMLENSQNMLLDMSQLNFVDSAGIGAILSCLRKLSAKGGDLKLCGVSRPVRASFEIARMHRIIDIFDACDEGLRAFEQT